jgi:hypothetical protein
MSHFTVLVIGGNEDSQLAKFDENKKVAFKDLTEDYRKQYDSNKKDVKEFYCSSSSSWGMRITEELFNELKKVRVGATIKYVVNKLDPFAYFTEGKKYCGYYTIKNKRCKGDAWFEVASVDYSTHPTKGVCFTGEITVRKIKAPKKVTLKEKYPNYNDYLTQYHGVEDVNAKKYGYWHNPNAKWDWYTLGGRWANMLELTNGQRTDVALKGAIKNLDEISTFAVLKDGKWYQRGEMGWFGMSTDEMTEDEWKAKYKELLDGLPDNTILAVYDCHI